MERDTGKIQFEQLSDTRWKISTSVHTLGIVQQDDAADEGRGFHVVSLEDPSVDNEGLLDQRFARLGDAGRAMYSLYRQ